MSYLPTIFKKIAGRVRLVVFFCLNKHKFRRLEFRALIIKPLRLDGSKHISLSKRVVIQKYSWLFTAKIDAHEPELTINEGSIIGNFNHITAVRKVVLGKNVLTADRVYISDNYHSFEDVSVPIMHQPVKFKSEVHIGDGTWIGENVCIIGAHIGKNCVIGAGSVVTKDIPDYCVAVGIPAVVIRQFDPQLQKWVTREPS